VDTGYSSGAFGKLALVVFVTPLYSRV
jgi:hypothetical protein